MKIEINYPLEEKRVRRRRDVIAAARWPFLFAAYICPVVNLSTGGRAWSLIVIWSLWMAWSLLLSPAMVEYNRISQVIKLIADSCVLLILIDVLLAPGWAMGVVPLVCFGGLALAAVLFFTDMDRQRQNVLPLLLLVALSIVCSAAGLILWNGGGRWPLVLMGAFSLALLVAVFAALGGGSLRELKKRFHTK